MKKKILLIGGAGYIGLKVTDYLLKQGEQVTCLDLGVYENLIHTSHFLGNSNYSFIFGDFCNSITLDAALKDVTDVVILAGLVGDPITKKYPIESGLINDLGIINCLKHLSGKGLNQVIFVSTCSNYGLISDGVLANENSDLSPLSLYAKSKVEAEKFLLSGGSEIDYTPTVLRFATAFGLSPRMRFDLTVNEFTRDLALGKDLLVFDADTWRPYCHVHDFSRLIYKVLSADKTKVSFEVFNAGGDKNNYTKRGVVDLILNHLPEMKNKVSYKDHGTDPRNYRVDFKKVREVLDFEPLFSVEDGVTEVISAVRNHVFNDYALSKNSYGNYEISYKVVE